MEISFIAMLLFAPLMLSFAAPYIASQSVENTMQLAATNTITRGPLIESTTNESTTIYWETTESAPSTVNYGKNTSMLEVMTNSTSDTVHSVKLTGLDLDAKYFYEVESGDAQSEMYYFFTAPADGGKFRMVILGDNRPSSSTAPEQPEVFSEIIDLSIGEDPHLVIMTGDFVYGVTESHSQNLVAWEKFTNITDRINHYAPIIGVIGNHDTGASTGSRLLEYYFDAFLNFGHSTTYFTFTYAGADFFILDSEEFGLEGRITGEQYEWLEEALSSSQSPLKIVSAHRPLYSISHIGSALDVNITERDRLQNLFEDENVTFFTAGHDHSYNRIVVNGVTHIITGGAGAPLYNTPWGGAYNHYISSNFSYSEIDYSVIKPSGVVSEHQKIPSEGPIEIFLRGFANTSRKENGTIPEIYFSEVPVTKYFSWDGNDNQTELTGLPDVEGNHTLDVYAENEEGQWGHVRYLFEAYIRDTTGFLPPDDTADGGMSWITNIAIASIVAGAAVAVVIVFLLRRRGKI